MAMPKGRRRGVRCGLSLLLVGMLVVGCGKMESGPIRTIVKAPSQPARIVIIHLGGPAGSIEPTDADIKDGLSEGGLAERVHYTLESREAGGEVGRIPGLVEEAVKNGAAVLMTLHSETTPIAADRAGKVPLVFTMAGDPFAAGLGKSARDHRPNLTGAFVSWGQDVMTTARRCLPDAKAFAILFNPDDASSVGLKEGLMKGDRGGVPVDAAEYRSETEAVGTAKALLAKGVSALFLAAGPGDVAPPVIEEARRAKVPVFGFTPEHVRAGAVIARVPVSRWGGFEAGRRAARVLSGDAPGSIPFVQGTDHVTWINDGAVRESGIKIPETITRGRIQKVGAE